MLPFWIGFSTQSLIQFNNAWLESTAVFLTFFAFCSPNDRPFGCRDCVRPLNRVRSTTLDREYYRCQHCGLIKLSPQTPTRPIQHFPPDSTRRVIALKNRRSAPKRSLGRILH